MTSQLATRVHIREVGPRDGFQNEPEQIAMLVLLLQDFNSYHSAELRIPRFPDGAHTASPQRGLDLIGPESAIREHCH